MKQHVRYGNLAGIMLLLLIILMCFQLQKSTAQIHATSPTNQRLTFYCGVQPPYDDIVRLRLQEAFRRIGIEVVVIALPSRRALALAGKDGDGDAARVEDIKTLAPEVCRHLLRIPEPSLEADLAVFTRGLDFAVAGWQSLQPYRNGFRLGARILEKNVPGRRTMVPTDRQLFKMLASGRLDTVIEWRLSGIHFIKELRLNEVTPLPAPLATVRLYPYIHERHARLVPELTAAIRTMRQDGSYARIEEAVLQAHGLKKKGEAP